MSGICIDVISGQATQVDTFYPDPVEQPAAEIAAHRLVAIDSRLTAIDLASFRALRAAVAGTATEADVAQLAALETEADALRAERAGLTAVSPVEETES